MKTFKEYLNEQQKMNVQLTNNLAIIQDISKSYVLHKNDLESARNLEPIGEFTYTEETGAKVNVWRDGEYIYLKKKHSVKETKIKLSDLF